MDNLRRIVHVITSMLARFEAHLDQRADDAKMNARFRARSDHGDCKQCGMAVLAEDGFVIGSDGLWHEHCFDRRSTLNDVSG